LKSINKGTIVSRVLYWAIIYLNMSLPIYFSEKIHCEDFTTLFLLQVGFT